jgi:hypothetical protein
MDSALLLSYWNPVADVDRMPIALLLLYINVIHMPLRHHGSSEPDQLIYPASTLSFFPSFVI